jgi:hypothetical protein
VGVYDADVADDVELTIIQMLNLWYNGSCCIGILFKPLPAQTSTGYLSASKAMS